MDMKQHHTDTLPKCLLFSLFLIFHVVYINTLQRTVGAHCRVVEPLFGSEFNLNPLRKVAEDYHVHYQDYDYILNICGPLNQACGSSSDAAVCQTKPNDDGFTPVDAGKNLFRSSGRAIALPWRLRWSWRQL